MIFLHDVKIYNILNGNYYLKSNIVSLKDDTFYIIAAVSNSKVHFVQFKTVCLDLL